jgi:hypothetical protein
MKALLVADQPRTALDERGEAPGVHVALGAIT